MEEKTETILTYLSLAVIVISLAFIGTSLTGRVTDTGTVNITVESAAAINFTLGTIEFGSGLVSSGFSNATLTTNGTGSVGQSNWTVVGNGFNISNIGNVNFTLNLTSDVDADAFLGGTNPLFQFIIDNSSATAGGACLNTSTTSNGNNTFANDRSPLFYGNFSTTTQQVCSTLGFLSGSNSVVVDVLLKVPSDATPGTQTATITATGTI